MVSAGHIKEWRYVRFAVAADGDGALRIDIEGHGAISLYVGEALGHGGILVYELDKAVCGIAVRVKVPATGEG